MKAITFRNFVDLVVTIILAVAGSAVLWRAYAGVGRPPEPPPAIEDVSNLNLTTSIPVELARGETAARNVIIEFADFECPFCGRYAKETLPGIASKYIESGRVRYVFRNLPLTKVHPNAMAAARAGHCAAKQGRFWQMHSRLFSEDRRLNDSGWLLEASPLGLDPSAFNTCFNASSTALTIEADMAEANRLGVNTTPTFLLGRVVHDGSVKITTRIRGAHPFAVFERALDSLEDDRKQATLE